MAIKLNHLTPVLVRNYLAGVNTFVSGKPAMGKTQTIEAFADQMRKKISDFKCWYFYAPTMSPMDIQASAPNYDKGTLELFNNEALPNAYVTPDAKGVVFFGELPNTDPATAKLLQKYINGEDMSGKLRKPDGVMIIADGNRIEDKSGVQQQGRAFLSRMEQLEVYADADDNAQYAAKHSWHPTVQLFFKDNPALIDNYDEVFETTNAARQRSSDAKAANGNNVQTEEGRRGIWASMRSWERISRKEYIADKTGTEVTLAEVAGNIGTGPAAQYEAFKKLVNNLPAFASIMADPANAPLPERMDEVYQIAVVVALKCSEDQMDKVKTYGCRMPLEMQAVLLRTLATRRGFNLASTPAYAQWIADRSLTALLNGR